MAHREEGGATGRSLADSVVQLAEQQKNAGARQMSGIAGAVHAAADQLEEQLPGASGYIHDAAERIDHAASDLSNSSLSDLGDRVRRLGHERPLALIGGSVLAGFVLTRFLISANRGSARQGEGIMGEASREVQDRAREVASEGLRAATNGGGRDDVQTRDDRADDRQKSDRAVTTGLST